jgi:hypothetical protein
VSYRFHRYDAIELTKPPFISSLSER